jgi:hypothetical protein
MIRVTESSASCMDSTNLVVTKDAMTDGDVFTGKLVTDHGKYLDVWCRQRDGTWQSFTLL